MAFFRSIFVPAMLAVVPLASIGVRGAGAQGPPAGSAISIPAQRFVLSNGLVVLLSPDHGIPQVAVEVTYHVGSRDEAAGRSGFAHLFEHVMLTGSEHVANGVLSRVVDGNGGTYNGFTVADRTVYYEVVPSNLLETVLWIESDRMGFLLGKFDSTKFTTQREVVRNEVRQKVHDAPYGRAPEIIAAASYDGGSSSSWTDFGRPEDLARASLDDVTSFFRTYYAPSNAVIAIVGDFDPRTVRGMMTKYFGELRGVPAPVRPPAARSVLGAERRLVYEDRVQVPRLFLSWPTVGDDHPDSYALDVLARVMTGARTARLTRGLVFDHPLAASVSALNLTSLRQGRFSIVATPLSVDSLPEVEQVSDEIIARLASEGPSTGEVEAAKAGLALEFVVNLQSQRARADALANGEMLHGDMRHYALQYARLQAVSPADVRRVAARYLGNTRVVLGVVPRGKATRLAHPESTRKVSLSPAGTYQFEDACCDAAKASARDGRDVKPPARPATAVPMQSASERQPWP